MSETQTFSSITVRRNGPPTADASWWNILRAAGLRLEQILGAGSYPETQQSVTNGQAATNITSFSFSSASYVGFIAYVSCYSNNGTNERRHIVKLTGWYNSIKAEWDMSVDEDGADCTSGSCSADVSGLTFTITAGGQVQVAADTMSGSPTRKIRWSVVKTFAVET